MKSATVSLLILAASMAVADQTTIRAPLKTPEHRQAAPAFTLTDSSGKTATLSDYRGKVVLLDFWATWCGGCKQEIPSFVQFSNTFGPNGLAVLGVSLDDEGWKVLKPFLAAHPIPYRIVLGDTAVSKQYAIESMPDTFLIDQQGRIAAAYRGGIVNMNDMESNIKALLAAH
jgi:cytochrome c biogenesis protein CcmG/thiol:disulfide interchange protein DsbE